VEGFAVDTNLLLHSTPRRLLCGIALETGQQIHVLPEVHNEVLRGITRVERQRFERRRKEPLAKRSAQEAIAQIRAVEDAATDWYLSELERGDSPLNLASKSEEDVFEIERIASELPELAFQKKRSSESVAGDTLVVAEAVYLDVDLLSTNNLNTINHGLINRWLRDKGWNRPLILDPSQTLERLSSGSVRQCYLWLLAHTMNIIHETDEENHHAFQRALNRLEASGFKQNTNGFESVLWNAKEYYKRDFRFQENLRSAFGLPARQAAYDAEMRLIEAVRRAA